MLECLRLRITVLRSAFRSFVPKCVSAIRTLVEIGPRPRGTVESALLFDSCSVLMFRRVTSVMLVLTPFRSFAIRDS